ncbi:acyltransferase [Gluconobacter cerevisiae]|uniref:Acyltransferase n=1 Tax=Gluconobacter cerevisiae TaxID=1379734 RepID=A0ABR9YHG3_9PROT|nr:acyltransferase [Gluconobacter cerevisiae]MBF0877953.1 acyltransferase [Gluconobacter cerevisiae]
MKRHYFPLIDVLRGFAAISVVVYHIINHFKWNSYPISGPLVWFRIGWMGVDLFFVISGFVIAISTMRTYDGSLNYLQFCKSFIRHRFARIVPLYYLTCFIFIIFVEPAILFSGDLYHLLGTHLFFIHNWFVSDQGAINGVNWSLGAEMQFYFLMMLVAPWLARAPWWLITMLSIAVSWGWRAVVFHYSTANGAPNVFHEFVYTTQMPGMLDEFGMGIIAAKFVMSDVGKKLMENRFFSYVFLPIFTIGSVLITKHVYWKEADYWQCAPMVICFHTFLAITCMLVVLLFCCLGRSQALCKALRPLAYLGTISYGIYLWHLSVILSLHRLDWLTGQRCIWIVLVASIILATLSWHFFEKPIYQRFTRKSPSQGTGS